MRILLESDEDMCEMLLLLTVCRFIDSFSNHIRSAVENAIKNKVMEGALKLDSFLGNLPKKIDLDSVAAMNVTFVNDPLFKSSSVEFDIDGLLFHRMKLLLETCYGRTVRNSTFLKALVFHQTLSIPKVGYIG